MLVVEALPCRGDPFGRWDALWKRSKKWNWMTVRLSCLINVWPSGFRPILVVWAWTAWGCGSGRSSGPGRATDLFR